MRDETGSGAEPSRRLVTLGAVGAALLGLSGCGIRLEDDAPRVPLVPTREPIPAETELVHLLTVLRAAALSPVVAAVPISGSLAGLHETQSTVLHDALRQRGVPEDDLATPTATPTGSSAASATEPPSPTVSPTTASTSSTASPTTSPTSSPTPQATPTGPSAVAESERTILDAGERCADAEADLRPMLLAILAQASAAIEIATGRPARAGDATPWVAPAPLVPVLTETRRATYFLEIAAARSDKKVREAMSADLATLGSLESRLVVATGDAAPAPELGYPLPSPVATAADVTRLARDAVTQLLAAWGSALAPLSASDASPAFADVPGWLGTVATVARRRGVALTAFPGLE